MELSETQFQRYARQIILPEIGRAGQETLLQGRVVVVGAGGLGSPILLYLAAAGVGRIDVIDPDVVDRSNLQRQVLHGESTLDRLKVESARVALRNLNPDVDVAIHPVHLTEENALELIGRSNVVVDGCDNFPTRYLINDACFFLKKPYVYGAVARFEGQASVFHPGREESPCYRCLYPEPPPSETIRSCREVGILGAIPGVIGMIQATECIKQLLCLGDSLVGRLLLYDALRMKFREIPLSRDPRCPLCGENPSITRLASYDYPSCESPGTAQHRM